MAELKTMHGILALIDVVNFTGQSANLGDKYTAQYTDYFQEKLRTIVEKWGFHVVKYLGDAALIFGTEPEGIIDIMKDLFERDKPEDKYGFISRFRMVAHDSYFRFKIENDKPVDFFGAEGKKVFRMEKYAQHGEMIVTHNLYIGVKLLLTVKNIVVKRLMSNEPLKGFDNEEWFPPFYRLRIANEETGVSNLLEKRLDELRRDVQFIPVFGNIYPPVSMDKNFINLSMVFDDDKLNVDGDTYRRAEKEDVDDWIYYRYRGGRTISGFTGIDVNVLYEKYKQGVIFGLPGAGKTTILRYLAFKEFMANQAKEEEEKEKQVVLFVPCRNVPFYDDWYKQRYGTDANEPDWKNAISFMTWVFLFGNKKPGELTPEQGVEFQDAEKKVKHAFKEKRLTLLLDALDEAPDMKTKERIGQLFHALLSENRLFLTSRPSERIHLKLDNIRIFNVLSLEMEQVRRIARHLMDEYSDVYKRFEEAVWQEEIVVKIAAAPMTALLVAAYFQAYRKFDQRFPMYDLLVKFILLNVWEKIKNGYFEFKDFDLFFSEARKTDFLEKYWEIKVTYDALAFLCFHLFYDSTDRMVHRSFNEETVRLSFLSYFETHWPGYGESDAKIKSEEWLEKLLKDHMLIRAGLTEYMFVHSAVMEYLAAYYLVEYVRREEKKFVSLLGKCLEREEYLTLETVPIAAGANIQTGFKILGMLRDLTPSYPRERLLEFGAKCLAELEWVMEKTFRSIRIESLKEPLQKMIRQNRESVDWLYVYLKELILTEDKEKLRDAIKRFDFHLRLSRETLLEEYLDYDSFEQGDSELVELRKQLLLKLVQEEVLRNWEAKHK
jgi:hypothetical protein